MGAFPFAMNRPTAVRNSAIKHLRAEGEKVKDIAQKFGIGVSTVHVILANPNSTIDQWEVYATLPEAAPKIMEDEVAEAIARENAILAAAEQVLADTRARAWRRRQLREAAWTNPVYAGEPCGAHCPSCNG